MTVLTAYFTAAVAIGAGIFAAWHMIGRKPFSNPLFYATAALEIVLLACLVGGAIALGKTDRDVEGGLFISYLVAALVIPPAAVVWGIAEKSRWGLGVVVVAMLTVAVLMVRCLQIWQGTYV